MKAKNLLKKAFLLLALVGGTTSAWANQTDLISGVTLPDIPGSTLDLSSQTDYTPDANGWIVETSPKANIGSKTWHSKLATDGGQTEWTVPSGTTAPFVSSVSDAKLNRYTVRSNARNHAIRFTGAEKASFLVSRNSDSRKAFVAVYSYVGTTQTLIESKSMASGSVGELLFDNLSSSTTYIAYIYGNATDNSDWYEFALKAPPAKTIDTQGLKSSGAVKVGESTLTLNAGSAGYSVSETTITLTDDQQSGLAPTNVKLVNHIVYTDSSTEDDDVDVSFDGTVTDGYYVGTATIDETNYTVKMKKDVTPTLALSATSADVTLKSYEVVKANEKALDPVKVTLTGANLTDGVYDVSATGLTISPTSFTVADGSVDQEFSINTTSSTAASTEVNFTVGGLTETFTLNLTRPAKRSVEQSEVSTATTWDWRYATSSTGSSAADVLLTKTGSDDYAFSTAPARDEEFVMATLPEVTNSASFNSQALNIKGQYVRRWINPEWAFQGGKISFTTTVPGTVQVTFGHTSNKEGDANKRYLYVNGTNTGVYSLSGHPTAVATVAVPAGDVDIEIYTNAATPVATLGRFAKVVFTPFPKLNASGYATFSAGTDMHIESGAKAYKATLDFANNLIDCVEIEDGNIPAGAGVILYGTANTQVVMSTTTDVAVLENNDLKGTTLSTGALATKSDGHTYYALSGNTFKYFTGAAFVHNKAYFEVDSSTSEVLARGVRISFGGITGIDQVENSKIEGSLPVKRIVNGKLVIEKKGHMFNANGQLIK